MECSPGEPASAMLQFLAVDISTRHCIYIVGSCDTQSDVYRLVGSCDTQSDVYRLVGSCDTQSDVYRLVRSCDTQSDVYRLVGSCDTQSDVYRLVGSWEWRKSHQQCKRRLTVDCIKRVIIT